MRLLLISLVSSLVTNIGFAEAPNIAKAIILKGEIKAKYKGKVTRLKKGGQIKEGTILASGPKSFVKLLFIDKSQMSLGPESQITVNKFKKNRAGIITLMKGQLRSKVTKDYMNIKDKNKSKLFIKTKTAAMGVRGTDFQVNYNPRNQNTSLITFSGAVAMAQIPSDRSLASLGDQKRLEKIVSSPSAVIVKKGQFSGVIPGKTKQATPPVKLNPAQLNVLKKNENFSSTTSSKKPDSSVSTAKRSVIPPGVNSKNFSNTSTSMEKEVSKFATISDVKNTLPAAPESSGVKAGGYIDILTVHYIAPPENSLFDAATQTYIPPASYGSFDPETGGYQNEVYTLTDKGEFILNKNTDSTQPGRALASSDKTLPPPVISYNYGGDSEIPQELIDDGGRGLGQLAEEALQDNQLSHDSGLDFKNTTDRSDVQLNFNAQ